MRLICSASRLEGSEITTGLCSSMSAERGTVPSDDAPVRAFASSTPSTLVLSTSLSNAAPTATISASIRPAARYRGTLGELGSVGVCASWTTES